MGLYKDMVSEPISELNLREAITIPPTLKVREVVQLLRERRLGCAIIVDANHRPRGLFTEAMLRGLVLENLAALDEPVERHMATEVPSARLSDPVVEVLEAMQGKDVRFVCVLDEEGKVHALTGQKGLMEYVAEHFPNKLLTQPGRTHPPQHEREGA